MSSIIVIIELIKQTLKSKGKGIDELEEFAALDDHFDREDQFHWEDING